VSAAAEVRGRVIPDLGIVEDSSLQAEGLA